MGKNNISRRYGMPRKAHKWITKNAESEDLNKVDIVNGLLSRYRKEAILKDEWSEPNFSSMGAVPESKVVRKGYRVDEDLDEWLDNYASSKNETKGDMLYKIIRYMIGHKKKGDFSISDFKIG